MKMTLSDLPFIHFDMVYETNKTPCKIMRILDEVVIDGVIQPLLLILVGHPSSSEYWIGSFVYEEGIGGRFTLNVHLINWITQIDPYYYLRNDLLSPPPDDDIRDAVCLAKKRIDNDNNIHTRSWISLNDPI